MHCVIVGGCGINVVHIRYTQVYMHITYACGQACGQAYGRACGRAWSYEDRGGNGMYKIIIAKLYTAGTLGHECDCWLRGYH